MSNNRVVFTDYRAVFSRTLRDFPSNDMPSPGVYYRDGAGVLAKPPRLIPVVYVELGASHDASAVAVELVEWLDSRCPRIGCWIGKLYLHPTAVHHPVCHIPLGFNEVGEWGVGVRCA